MTDTKIEQFPRSLPEALSSVARLVPGYRGYAGKDDRHEEDRRLRAQVVRCLRESSQDLHRAVRGARFEGTPPGLVRVGDVARRLDRLAVDVAHATTGEATLLTGGGVDGARLELLYRADIAVAEGVQGLVAEVGAWVANPVLDGSALSGVETALDLAETAWRARHALLDPE